MPPTRVLNELRSKSLFIGAGNNIAERIRIGPNFCHVVAITTRGQLRPVNIGGNQKCIGASPSFRMSPIIIKAVMAFSR